MQSKYSPLFDAWNKVRIDMSVDSEVVSLAGSLLIIFEPEITEEILLVSRCTSRNLDMIESEKKFLIAS